MTCHFTCTPRRYLWKNLSSTFALRSGKEIPQACIAHTWVVLEILFTPEAVVKPQEVLPCITHDRELQCQWCFQTAPTASSGLVLLSLNILPTYNPPKSKMLPWMLPGDGYEAPLFWSCWQLDVPKHCRVAALMQLSEAACIQGQMWAVLPLEKLLQILEALLYLIFELMKFWCLGQKSQQQPQKNCSAFTCQHHHNWEGKPSRFEK